LADDPRFSSNAARTSARAELRDIIVEAFTPMTADEVIARLDAAKIANAHVNDMHALWEHPQLKARKRWRDVESPAGILPALIPSGLPDSVPVRMDAIPALGQDTQAILTELGYDDGAIEHLRDKGVV
jgi:itaconate CoA-transferase